MSTPASQSSPDIAISARNVVKTFRQAGAATSLKERLLRRGPKRSHAPFVALNDITIDIHRGHTVGLIGHNGSGKSTLLKVLAGILHPNQGTVEVNGRVASLLELGAGFNSELSGRENIYLNGTLLGLTKHEIDGLYDSIVEFSELGAFIDDPVKHYSSGMYVRLGFAVAVHVDPDILLIDEVLAVGDEAFQEKCMAKIHEFQNAGKTILVVSHALDTIMKICDRAIVLDHGNLIVDGDPTFATAVLRTLLGTGPREEPEHVVAPASPDYMPIEILSASVMTTPDGPEVNAIRLDEPLIVRVTTRFAPGVAELCSELSIVVMSIADLPVLVQTHRIAPGEIVDGSTWTVDFVTADLPPLQGGFVVAAQITRHDGVAIANFRSTKAFTISRSSGGAALLDAEYTSATVASQVPVRSGHGGA